MALKCLMTFVAVGLLSAATTPVTARRQPGTIPLLTTMENKGVLVRYDPPQCTSDIRGQYLPHRVEIWLCTGNAQRKSPDDHNTVRHEAWHYLQHCRHGGPRLKTFYTSKTVFATLVTDHVPESTYRYYAKTLSGRRRLVELEATAAANAYTSAQIDQLIKRYC